MLPRSRPQCQLHAFKAEVANIQEDELRADYEAVADLLADDLSIMLDLRNAVASGDRKAARAALRRAAELQRERARVTQLLLNGPPGS
jgi:hypothetical protein